MGLIVPAELDAAWILPAAWGAIGASARVHVTAELLALATVATNCWLSPAARLELAGVSEIVAEEIDVPEASVKCVALQDVRRQARRQAAAETEKEVIRQSVFFLPAACLRRGEILRLSFIVFRLDVSLETATKVLCRFKSGMLRNHGTQKIRVPRLRTSFLLS